MKVEEILFEISEVLEIPVLVLAVLALALVLVEAGALIVELRRRRLRSLTGLEEAIEESRRRLAAGIADGSIEIRYQLVHTAADGTVTVSDLPLDPAYLDLGLDQ